MKKIICGLIFLMVLCVAGAVSAETNYAAMSTIELSQLRQKIKTVSPQERKKFEAEWGKRMQAMPQAIKERHFPEELEEVKDSQTN